MGYDPSRFVTIVDEELVCSICSCVFKDPLWTPKCDHTFCCDCINIWLLKQPWCPIDHQPLKKEDLRPAPRALRNLLLKLDIACDFASIGCTLKVKLESLSSHSHECTFNPDKTVPCNKGCGIMLLRRQLQDHNCLIGLRELCSRQADEFKLLRNEIAVMKQQQQNFAQERQKQINELKMAKRQQMKTIDDLKSDLMALRDQIINEKLERFRSLQAQLAEQLTSQYSTSESPSPPQYGNQTGTSHLQHWPIQTPDSSQQSGYDLVRLKYNSQKESQY